ncbi:MAG TPA: hypothetical protein VGC54_01630 [Planctomycetota bacterium]
MSAAREPATTALLAAAVLLPLAAWSPFVPSDARLDGGVLACVIAPLVLLAASRRRLPMAPGTLAWLGALACATLALWHRGPSAEIHGALGALPPVLGGLSDRAPLLAGWLLFCAAAGNPVAARCALPWVGGGLALASALGLLQALGMDPLGLRPEPQSPPVAPFANTNAAAEVLAPALLAAAALYATLPASRSRKLLLGGIGLAGFHVGLLGVLAARVATGLGIGLLALRARRGAPAGPARWLAPLALAVVFLAGEAARLALRPAWNAPAEPAAATATASAPERSSQLPRSLEIRRLLWTASLQRSLAEPLGIGLGRFEIDYPFWRPPEELRLSSVDFRDPATPRPTTPHSEPLLFLLEGGWIALALFFLAGWRALRRPDRDRRMDAALLAFAVHSLVRSPLSDNPAALAVGALLLGASMPGTLPLPATRGRTLAGAGLALLALVPAAAAPAQISGELAVAARFRAQARDDAILPQAAQRAVQRRPWDATAWCLLAADLSAAGAKPAAIREALSSALRHDPANLYALTAFLKLEMVADDGDETLGLSALAWAERIAPAHPSVREGRTLWLEQQSARFKEGARAEVAAGDPRALAPLLYRSHLFAALAAARRGNAEAAGEAVRAAAVYAGESRLRLEHIGREGPCDETSLRALFAALLPDLEDLLGPPPR